MVEKSGTTLKRQLQRSDPFSRSNSEPCGLCISENPEICHTSEVTYCIKCINCKEIGVIRKYIGQTSRSLCVRCVEHMLVQLQKSDPNSWAYKHKEQCHLDEEVRYSAKITGVYRRDAMLRQISEAVQIRNTPQDQLLNSRTEWNSKALPYFTLSQ